MNLFINYISENLKYYYFKEKMQQSRHITYSSVLSQNLMLGKSDIRIKIADLGNACFDVSWMFFLSWFSQ